MKKIISLLLVAAMSVSLAACGSKAQTDNNEPQTSESGLQQETEDNQSGESNSESKIVELTAENWADYFEIVKEEGFFTNPDSGGKKQADWRYIVVLKDGVVISEETSEEIIFEFSYDEEERLYTLDENVDLVWGDALSTKAKTGSAKITVPNTDFDGESAEGKTVLGLLIRKQGNGYDENRSWIIAPNNLKITNVSGKLPLE